MKQQTSTENYINSLEHLVDELRRIDIMIRLQILRSRMMVQGDMAEFRGLCIKEEEIDAILSEGDSFGIQMERNHPNPKPLQDNLATLEIRISEKKANSLRRGTMLRLEQLRELFLLSSFDAEVLLISLILELDRKYEMLYSYLQDDVTKKRPSVDLTLKILCPSFETTMGSRKHFTPTAPLFKYHLMHLFDDPSHHQSGLLNKYLKVDDRITNYLLNFDEVDAHLLSYARHIKPKTQLHDLHLSADMKHHLRRLTQEKGVSGEGLIFYFQGSYGVGKQTTAEALCREQGIGVLIVDGKRLQNLDEVAFENTARLIAREALLQRSALYWDSFDSLLVDDKRTCLETLVRELEGRRGMTFLAGETPWEPVDTLQEVPFVRVEFPRPTYTQRVQLWKMSLDGNTPCGADVDLTALANKFRFGGGQIRDAAVTARNLARWREPDKSHVTMDDLFTACRLQSNRKLATLAQKITPHYRWEEIVLPLDRMEQLREICNYVKYRPLVYDEWGFESKLSLGKGLNVLFAGPSGTGKTMSAEIIAHELGLDLYKIDLSIVVSKYIGETEKNLARIFAEAETSNAILFFDEADALFGKRSEVRDSHDRYANIEIGYLLQKMEEYMGIAILATNLSKNIDEAFLRRMHFTVEFPFPDERQRYLIWKRIYPENAPLAENIDYKFLSERVKLPGGNIKNMAVASAFYAAAHASEVAMRHVMLAAEREYKKLGRSFLKSDFEPYYGLIEAK